MHFALQQNDLVRECPETPGGITTNEKAHPVNPGALNKLALEWVSYKGQVGAEGVSYSLTSETVT